MRYTVLCLCVCMCVAVRVRREAELQGSVDAAINFRLGLITF